jgi:hypothetical protein
MHSEGSSRGTDNSNPFSIDKVDKEVEDNRVLHGNITHQMHLLG